MEQVTYVQKNLDRIKFVSEPESLYPAADWKNLLLHVVVFQNDKFYMFNNVHSNLTTSLAVDPSEFEKFGAMSVNSAYFFLLKRYNFLKTIRPDMVFTPKESIINSQSGNDEVTSIIISTSNPSDGDLYIDVEGMLEMKEVPVYLRMKCLRKVSDLLRKRVIAKAFEEDIEFLDFDKEVDRKKQEILHFTSNEGQLDVSRICDVNHKQLISFVMIVEKEGELYYKGIADSNSFAAMGANVKPEFKAWLHDHSEILTYHDIFKMVMRPKLFDQDITDLFLDAFMDLRSPKQTIRYNDGRVLGHPTGKVFIAYFQVLHPDSFNGLLSKENKAFLDFSMSELVKVPADSIVNKMPRYSRSSIALYSEVAKAQRLSAILKELCSK